MRYKRVLAVAMSVVMAVGFVPMLTGAHETTPIMVTEPPEGVDRIPVAVFFADNMVFAPQWRIGNYVRIEVKVLNMTDLDDPSKLHVDDLWLWECTNHTDEDGLMQRELLTADSTRLAETRMVSVSYMKVEMALGGEVVDTFEAGWDPDTWEQVIKGSDERVLGREINKHGSLIYGMLWDTTGLVPGAYTVHVSLGKVVQAQDGSWTGAIGEWYDVGYAVANYYIAEGTYYDDEHPFVIMADEYGDELYIDYKIGIGGVEEEVAYVILGNLIPQGSGGGQGDGGGNGNGGDGGGGNGNGGDGDNGRNGNGFMGNRKGHSK